MIICSVVGIRKSGKTTTVIELIGELKSRGYRVGTVKTVFCPSFSIDEEGSNTDLHKKAGADVVCARARNELAVLYPYGVKDNDIFSMVDVDILLLEGDYEAKVPRIVCAHRKEDALERINQETIAVVGRISDKKDEIDVLKKEYTGQIFHTIHEIGLLADVVTSLESISLPVEMQQTPGNVASFCQCGCHKAEQKCGSNAEHKLQANPRRTDRKHIFLTGEKQSGKTTVLEKSLAQLEMEMFGYQTKPYEIAGQRKGHYMHCLSPLEAFENDFPISIRVAEKKSIPVTETFETLGVRILEQAKSSSGLLVVDELGRLERDAVEFQQMLFACMDVLPLVVGVLQKTNAEFIAAIKQRADVQIIEVNEGNRESLPEVLRAQISDIWENR